MPNRTKNFVKPTGIMECFIFTGKKKFAKPDGEVKLGSTVRDKITGFTGVVTGRCEYITGCAQLLIQPKMIGGLIHDARWYDEPRLEGSSTALFVLDSNKDAGADIAAPIK